jgi:phenylpyruvate tautomerase PptA (4-oxalocrotonate tautomerase family)
LPIIRIEMWAGRNLDQRRALAHELTKLLVEITGCELDTVPA